jgi:poly(3-hydroxybutyrate) depolymerase
MLIAILLLVVTAAAPAVLKSAPLSPQDTEFPYTDGRVFVHVPPHASRIGVLVLHSRGHTAAEPVAQGWSATADRHGFVAIYPERGVSWNAGLCCGTAAADERDDVSWLVGLIANVRARYHLSAIYLAGFSNGGMMVERLVAEEPGISDRFAVWGAAPEMPTPGFWSGVGDLFEGSHDALVPRFGGTVTFDGATTQIRPATDTASWIRLAQLRTHVIAGWGHPPPPAWPELAWAALARAR